MNAPEERLASLMRRPVATTHPDRTGEEAWKEMQGRGIHHLVVVRGSQVIGILSDRDLGGPRGAAVRSGRRVADLMSSRVVKADPGMTVRQAASLCRSLGISCLPVVEESRLVGIVTVTDFLDALIRGGPPSHRPSPAKFETLSRLPSTVQRGER